MSNSRLDNLYLYLIENRKHYYIDWYYGYVELVLAVETIRQELISGKDLKNETIYLNTIFKDHKGFNTSFDAFMYRFIKMESGNGISSNGQSVVGQDDFDGAGKFKNNNEFIIAVENLIKYPNRQTYRDFKESWIKQGAKNNKVLINRTAAACTVSISSTVDEGKFNELFYWMIKESLIGKYNGSDDWFERNEFLISEIDKELTLNNGDVYWRNIFIWVLYEYIGNPFNLKKQIIKYGAPGTGKTYGAKLEAHLQFNIWNTEYQPGANASFDKQIEIVQFHPSFSYEDFIEGLRPVLKDGRAELSLQNGVFKVFCKEAAKWELDVYELVGEDFDWNKATIKELIENEGLKSLATKEHWNYIFNQNNKEKRVVDALPPYFFIIDEINRAELSRVFGELMYSLENRGVKGKIKTQYANLNSDDTAFLKIKDSDSNYQFFIPQNVFVIGTMNTIDRSVESFDFALRRRFIWEEVKPNIPLLRSYLTNINTDWAILANNLESLNNKIKGELLLGADFQIGHSYLMNLPYKKFITPKEVRENVWNDSIKPLLEEYLRGTGKSTNEYAKAFGIHL